MVRILIFQIEIDILFNLYLIYTKGWKNRVKRKHLKINLLDSHILFSYYKDVDTLGVIKSGHFIFMMLK